MLMAQKEFSFNLPGNSCYFQYVCYAHDFIYSSKKRPVIFILSPEGIKPIDAFDKDSIKNQPTFYNYYFVYIPNKGGTPKNKLYCIEALASLITFGFENGHKNLFLQINDPLITMDDINSIQLQSVFKSIRLSKVQSGDTIKIEENISEKFKASSETDIEPDVDEYGTFYTEVTNTAEDQTYEKAQKVYFGPPQSFNFTLSGIVRDKSTGEALPFATILIKGSTFGTSTNADGYFTLLKVPSDTSTLIVRYIGYDDCDVFLTPQSPKKNLIVELHPSSRTLKSVTITANREDIVIANKMDVGVIKMTPKKMEQIPNLGEKDIMRSFQLMPGISAANESSSGLYVRGGTPDQNLILYDGFPVYQVDHLYGFFSAFNSNAVKDVQLYKGGFESRFGGKLSSVMEITGKDGNQKRFNMGVDASLLSFNSFVEVPIGNNFTSIVTFRRSYKGPIYNAIFKKFNLSTSKTNTTVSKGPGGRMGQETTITSYFYDLNGKFIYRPTDIDIVSLSFYQGTDKLDNSMSSQMPSMGTSNSEMSMSSTDLTKYGNYGSSLKWSRKWSSKFYGNTLLSYSKYFSYRERSQENTTTDSDGNSTTRKNGLFEDNDLMDYSIKSDYVWDVLNSCQIQFGGFGTYYDIAYSYSQNDSVSVLDRTSKTFLSGLYVQSKTQFFKDKIQFIPGIRLSHFEITNKIYAEPRASLTFGISKNISLKASTGKYYQFVNRVTREDIMSGSKDFWLLSDGYSVPVSSANHYMGGLFFETGNYLFSIEGYYKTLDSLTEHSLRINPSPVSVSINENFFKGKAYSKGLEFLIQKKTGNFNGWMSYTLGEAKSYFDVYSDSYYPSNQDVTHEFKSVLMYKYKRWDFSATWVYATGRPYTAPSGAYSITLLDGTTQDYFTVTSKNGLRLPDYHRCDIAANYKLLAGNKGDKKRREIGSIGASIFNLYNRTNVWYKQFSIEDGEIIETNVNYLGITPNINLSLKLW